MKPAANAARDALLGITLMMSLGACALIYPDDPSALSVGTVIDDKSTGLLAEHQIHQVDPGLSDAHISVTSYNGVALLSECTATVSLNPSGTGSFDPACTPDLALVDATTYTTIIFGKSGGSPYGGRLDFVYEATP